MNTVILPEVVAPTFTAPPVGTRLWAPAVAIPEKQLYWQGYDQFVECFFANDFLSPEEFAAMLPEEKRGYEYAQRCQSDCETDVYLSNTNAYGDRTQY